MFASDSKETSSIFRAGFLDEDPGPLSPSPGPDRELSEKRLTSDEAALQNSCVREVRTDLLFTVNVLTDVRLLLEGCILYDLQLGLCI